MRGKSGPVWRALLVEGGDAFDRFSRFAGVEVIAQRVLYVFADGGRPQLIEQTLRIGQRARRSLQDRRDGFLDFVFEFGHGRDTIDQSNFASALSGNEFRRQEQLTQIALAELTTKEKIGRASC